ncbi:adenylyl-sulfate kinase [Paeniglutamicibacter cryotolerans]|uniref:Adenylyl-sulfate kinase n=1 Tax=Paeniglutamicibacter cryotolerans TaxID=670079 RepID=A0A839QJH8_9MICC|nr:adenylyl-sulfate kinase [Paeniglutamicibacter cryotolerans]MBB2996000.1 sulfate adenylyltransferase [Paeniglutamicibacter cryotolerans]
MRDLDETLHLPVVTLPDGDLDALELLLGGLINDELSYPIGMVGTLISAPAHPELTGAPGVLLADRDRTPLARAQLAPESASSISSSRLLAGGVSALARAEHGPFRGNRITSPVPGTPVVLLDGAPTPVLLERIRSFRNTVASSIQFVLITTSAEFRNPDFAGLLAELEAGSRLVGAVNPGILVVPPDIPAAIPLARLRAKVLLDARNGESLHRADAGKVVLLSGLSGSGKSTVGRELLDRIRTMDRHRAVLLDGDDIRQFLSKGLGFSREDRETNVERIGWVAARVSEAGGVAICTPIAPFEETRARLKTLAEEAGGFLLVHVSTPLEICEQRDRKGLYAKARAGLIGDFTGISSPYETPLEPDLTIDTTLVPVATAVDLIIDRLYPGEQAGS